MSNSTDRLREWRERYGLTIVVLLLIWLFASVLLAEYILITIDSGQVGVQWSRFFGGTITDRIYDEGLNVIFPWNKMTKYNARFQEVNQTLDVLSNDGLQIEVEIQVRYRPIRNKLPLIHKHAGPDYVEILLMPEVASHVRQTIAGFTPDELYAEDRLTIQNLILKKLKRRTGVAQEFEETRKSSSAGGGGDEKKDPDAKDAKKSTKSFDKDADQDWIHVEDVFIKNIRLPELVATAIESKLKQEQLMLEYDYILQKEEKEKKRKIIEAQGIAEFQRATGGLSILKWKGIEATVRLSESPNAKLVIIGSGEEGGMPLILGPMSGLVPPEQVTPPPALTASQQAALQQTPAPQTAPAQTAAPPGTPPPGASQPPPGQTP